MSFLQDILGSRTLNDRVLVLLSNLNTYLQFTSREPTSAWESQLSHFEAFFRKLPSVLPENVSLLLRVGSLSQYVYDGRWSFPFHFTLLCGLSSILFAARFSPLSINFKYFTLTLLLWRMRQGSVLECVPHVQHVQHDYFSSFNHAVFPGLTAFSSEHPSFLNFL